MIHIFIPFINAVLTLTLTLSFILDIEVIIKAANRNIPALSETSSHRKTANDLELKKGLPDDDYMNELKRVVNEKKQRCFAPTKRRGYL